MLKLCSSKSGRSGNRSGNRPSSQKGGHHHLLPRFDIYAYNPTYEWTAYKTIPGTILSWLTILFIVFYMVLTTRDYIVRPPELVSQGDIDLVQVAEEYSFVVPKLGLRIGYTDESDPNALDLIAALENDNPYVRIRFHHVVMQNQRRVQETLLPMEECIVSHVRSVCPVLNGTTQLLQGTYFNERYQFLEIRVDKCGGGDDDLGCANSNDIDTLLHSGSFRIRAQFGVEAEQFDVERFHATGVGQVKINRSLEFFHMPDVELRTDIVLKARTVSKEQRYLGSPPMPETEINILSFDRKETSFKPRMTNGTRLMTFSIRIDDNVRLEEVNYWCPSLLDLFGLWGAMVSFMATMSLGFFAMLYNRWSFDRHFHKTMARKRREAQLLTMSSMAWMKKRDGRHGNDTENPDPEDAAASKATNTRSRQSVYRSLQEQHDALMVEPDIRLFESHHFEDQSGRMHMSAAELKHPSTAFGELRRMAILEHGKKKRAAKFLGLWYGRHLVKKGFIQDPVRRAQLFCPPEFTAYNDAQRSKKTLGRKIWTWMPSIHPSSKK